MSDILLKRCTKCGEEKPATTEFFRRNNSGLHAQCKVCRSSSDRLRRRRPEIKEHCRAYEKDRKENRRVYQHVYQHRLEYLEHRKDWWGGPKGRALHTIYKHNRRALKLASGGTYTPQDIQNMLKGQKGKCAKCKQKLITSGPLKYHVDHIVPLSRGGSNWSYNLQLLCPTCNISKRDKFPHEFDGSGQMRLLS